MGDISMGYNCPNCKYFHPGMCPRDACNEQEWNDLQLGRLVRKLPKLKGQMHSLRFEKYAEGVWTVWREDAHDDEVLGVGAATPEVALTQAFLLEEDSQ